MSNGTATVNGTGAYKGGIPLNVTLHSWPIPKLDTNLKQANETNYMIDKNSESAKNYTNSLHNLNATGYVAIDDDLTDTGLTDVQTFILAGVATVIPLLVIVVTILGIRFLWRRYRETKEDGYEGVLQKEESSEPLGKLQSFSLPLELKSSDSQFTVTQAEDLTSTPSTQLPTPKSNGNVITMTLKNNHLIVETEEGINTPEGLKIESKGTTTKFVTSKASDFRFDAHSESAQDYSKQSSGQQLLERSGNPYNIPSSSDHGALVHCPPEDTEDELERGSCNTGLSQSDLSVSSTESQNPNYRYGNQMGYDSGGYGYPEYSGYSTVPNKQDSLSQTGPKTHKIYMRGYSITEQTDALLTDSQAGGPKLKDILMSDIQAREEGERNIENEHIRNGSTTADTSKEIIPENESSQEPLTLSKEPEEVPDSKDSAQVIHTKTESIQLNTKEYLSNNGVLAEENNKS